jgi:hypothetical protein
MSKKIPFFLSVKVIKTFTPNIKTRDCLNCRILIMLLNYCKYYALYCLFSNTKHAYSNVWTYIKCPQWNFRLDLIYCCTVFCGKLSNGRIRWFHFCFCQREDISTVNPQTEMSNYALWKNSKKCRPYQNYIPELSYKASNCHPFHGPKFLHKFVI